MVHEEVKSLLLPGSAGVLVPAEAAQQLDTGPITGGIVSTAKENRIEYDFIKHGQLQLTDALHLPSQHEK